MKHLSQAGDRLNDNLRKKIIDYAKYNNINFTIIYGATETTCDMTYTTESDINISDSIGRVIPYGRIELRDKSGKIIDNLNEIGEIVYSGSNVAMGYADTWRDYCRSDDWNGTYNTGDIAFTNGDYYILRGRLSRFVKAYGNRINLDDIEIAIQNNYTNIECICNGDDKGVNIFIKSSDKLDIEEIHKYISRITNINKKFFTILKVNKLIMTSSGKKLYNMTI